MKNLSTLSSLLSLSRLKSLLLSIMILISFGSVMAEENKDFDLEVTLTAFDFTCSTPNGGAVTSVVSGGVPGYTYLWSNGETTPGIVDLLAGEYSLTVTDNIGNTASASAIVNHDIEIPALQLNASYETCVGSCDGNVSVNASGGSGNFSYLWNTGETFVVEEDACAGLYTVTVTDNETACTAVGSIELELSPEGIWLMTSGTDATCANGNDGTAHVSIMTGVAPYTIVWSDGQTGEDITGLSAGNYTVSVTDVNGCFNAIDINIGEGTSTLDLDMNASYETCVGSCDANASVNVSGGVEPYTYAWSNGSDFVIAEDVCAGTQTVTVTDASGCIAVGSVEVELSPEGVWLMVSGTDVTCPGGNDGTAHVSVMAGEAPYTIVWSDGQTGEDATNLSAGTYTVTATDANDCSNSETITISEPAPIEIVVNYTEDAECGGSDGQINIGINGSAAGFTYLWSNGATTMDLEDIPAGDYSVTVTNTDGCTATLGPITISGSSPVEIVLDGTEDTNCGENSGSINISVTGGGGYTYAWSNGASTEDLSNLGAGSYTVSVVDSEGCKAIYGPVTILDSSPIEIVLDGTEDANCGADDGSINISVSGGGGSYTYAWSNGATTEDLTNIGAGDYTVTVTSAAGCTATLGPITISETSPVVIVLEDTEDANCGAADGSINISVSGGGGSYTYAWSNGATTEDLTNISAGDYTITVTSAAGCTATLGPITISETSPIVIVLDGTEDANCGATDGSINISVSGGGGSYTYVWSNGATTEDLTNIGAGDYTVTVTSIAGCTATLGPITVDEEDCCDEEPVISSVVIIEASCGNADGSATIEMVGNNADYTYTWSPNVGTSNTLGNAQTNLPSGDYSVTIANASDPNCPPIVETFTIGNRDFPDVFVVSSTPANCNNADGSVEMSEPGFEYLWCNGATGHNPTNLPAGECQVQITDPSTGCTDNQTVIIEEENNLTAQANVNNYPDCGMANGSVTINVSNGSGNYDYAWSNGATGMTQTGLSAGAYNVTVTDTDTECQTSVAFMLINGNIGGAMIDIDEPVSTTCVGSDDGNVVFNITYDQDFEQPATIEIVDMNGDAQSNGSLEPGEYCIMVTDANGCIAGNACFEVVEPTQIDVDVAINDECPAPGITLVEVIGGNGGYTFDWADLAGTNDPQNRPDLLPGTYSVTVTDVNGCTAAANNLVITAECQDCPGIEIESVVIVEATCGNADGRATILMVGDEASYTYTWSPNIGIANTNGNERTDLPSGPYSVTISGSDPNCPDLIEMFTIGVSDGPDAEVLSTTAATCNESNGTAVMSNQNYTYEWCNGATGYNPTNLPAGECQVTITDPVTGCSDYRTVVIEEFNPLVITTVVNNYPECGQANGSVTINVTMGSTNYSYAWSNGATTQTATGLAAGSYCVTVTDNGPTGCEKEFCFILTNDVPGVMISIDEPVTTNCIGTDDGTVVYNIVLDADFVGPETVEIVDAEGNIAMNGSLAPGTYCIKVSDANGCIAGQSCFEVTSPDQIDLDIALNNLCDPTPGIEVTEVSGGTAPYTFNWADLPGSTNPMNRPDLETGSYDLTVTDVNGCSVAVNNLSVIDTCACPPMIISSVVVIESSCGTTTGQATVTIADEDNLDLTYQWSANNVIITNGGKSITNAGAGVYSVTITIDGQPQCNLIEEFSIGNSDGPEASFDITAALCGSSDGSCTFSNPDYNYVWSDGVSGVSRNDLTAGTYFVTISDPNDPDCIDVKTVVVDETPSFSVSSVVNSLPDCGMSNGSVTITPSVAGNYSYSWGDSGTISELTSGVYTVTVTDMDNGCTASTLFTLIDNIPNTTITINSDAFISCPGGSDGLIDYTFSTPGGFALPATVEIQDENGNVVDNGTLSEGNYCLIIKDANGCISGAECLLVRAPSQIDVDVAVYDEDCDELGEIQLVEVLGGNGGYTYQWSNPITTTSAVAEDLATGSYSFTVTDNKGCSVDETVFVEDDPDALSILASPDTTFCIGTSIDISVDLLAGNVEWTDQAGMMIGTTPSIAVTESGTYYVEVTNGGCFQMDSVMVTNGAVEVDVMTDNFACQDVPGQLLMVENLDPIDILTYDWSPDSLIVGDENTGSPEILSSEGGLLIFTVDITNQFGCTTTETVNVAVIDSVEVPEVFTDVQCDGTTVDFEIEGESPVYLWFFDENDSGAMGVGSTVSYEYPSGGIYNVMVVIPPVAECFESDTIMMEVEVVDPPLANLGFEVDLDECSESATLILTDTSSNVLSEIDTWDWTSSTGDTSESDSIVIEVTESQTVEVELIITTVSGCMDTINQVIPIDLVEVEVADVSACFGTSELLNEGGSTEYTYEWSPANVLDDENAPSPLVTSNEDVMFIVTVTNSQGCVDIDTVNYTVTEDVDIMIDSDGPEFCSGDAVSLSANSSNATSYVWYDASGNMVSTASTYEDAIPGAPGMPNAYVVQASLNGCTSTDTLAITNMEISLEVEGPTAVCIGDTVFLIPFYGNEEDALIGATYTWTGLGIVDTPEPDEIMVIASETGEYSLEVSNEFCSGIGTAFLEVSSFDEAQAVADPDTIFLSDMSQLEVFGRDDWDYEWSPQSSILSDPTSATPEVQPEETTIYTVEITDSIGCVDVRTVQVTVVTPECEEPWIFFPNAFSPNGDGYNDVLYLRGQDVTEVFFAIYDRWGEKVFESNSQNVGWDGTFRGKELCSDVYGFYLRVRCGNGDEFYKQGNVTLFK